VWPIWGMPTGLVLLDTRQELLHAYSPVGRIKTLDAAMELVSRPVMEVWSLESEDMESARHLHDQYPELGGRDLCHLVALLNDRV
jgi:hypothetical protein